MSTTQPFRMAPYSYESVTRIATEQISVHMRAAKQSTGMESLVRRERAYGVYIGWKALVQSHPDHAQFLADDKRLDELQRVKQ